MQQKSAAEPKGERQRDGRHAANTDKHVIITTTSNTMQFNIIGRGGGDSPTATACPHPTDRPKKLRHKSLPQPHVDQLTN